MLKIKLARYGKRNQPHYRVIVQEAKTKRDGAYLEMIGHYIPMQRPKVLEIDLERYQYWLDHGAQPTETVAALAKRLKSGEPFPEPPKVKKEHRPASASKKSTSKKSEKSEADSEEKEKEEKSAKKAAKEAAKKPETAEADKKNSDKADKKDKSGDKSQADKKKKIDEKSKTEKKDKSDGKDQNKDQKDKKEKDKS